MTKKHFIALAREIALIQDAGARKLACAAAIRCAIQFNPAFCRAKFCAACNVAI